MGPCGDRYTGLAGWCGGLHRSEKERFLSWPYLLGSFTMFLGWGSLPEGERPLTGFASSGRACLFSVWVDSRRSRVSRFLPRTGLEPVDTLYGGIGPYLL